MKGPNVPERHLKPPRIRQTHPHGSSAGTVEAQMAAKKNLERQLGQKGTPYLDYWDDKHSLRKGGLVEGDGMYY